MIRLASHLPSQKQYFCGQLQEKMDRAGGGENYMMYFKWTSQVPSYDLSQFQLQGRDLWCNSWGSKLINTSLSRLGDVRKVDTATPAWGYQPLTLEELTLIQPIRGLRWGLDHQQGEEGRRGGDVGWWEDVFLVKQERKLWAPFQGLQGGSDILPQWNTYFD